MVLGKAQEMAVGTICAVCGLVGLKVEAAGETSVQFAACNPLCTISHLLAVSHPAFCFFIAVSNT